MEQNQILSVAQTILAQLTASTDINVILSWDFQNPIATLYHNKPALAFCVKARLFKGLVVVALNDADLYEISLLTATEERCLTEEAYADQFSEIIDIAIERGNDPHEYEQFCQQQLNNLVQNTIIIL